MRALTAFAVLTLALLNGPAWGGGWESSGSPSQSPVMGSPSAYLPYTCVITVRHSSQRDQFHYTEILKPEHFKNGSVRLVTPSFKGHEFLAGHQLVFYGYEPREQFDGRLTLALDANLMENGHSIAKAAVRAHAPMKDERVSTEVSLTNVKSKETTDVRAHCYKTRD